MEKEIVAPEVGMGATICYWTDRHAGTIIAVSASGREVKVQVDKAVAKHKNIFTETQDYEYSPNPEGSIYTFTLRKNGRYVEKGSSMKGTKLWVGDRREYYDPSF
jgi:hypothetical protein